MEDWKREQAEQREEVAALLAGIADGTTDAYEGAFAAYRILQNGGRLLKAERLRRDADKEPVDDLPEERDDLRRLILMRMVDRWEARVDLRLDVEREIVEFACAWCSGGEQGVLAQWSRWRAWWDPRGVPLDDAERAAADGSERTIQGGRRRDLRRVQGARRVEGLSLWRCELGSLDGIERFESLRGLSIVDVKGLTDLRAIERVEGLRFLDISTKSRALAEAVAELDLSRLPELHGVSLACWAGDVREPIRIDTSWVAGARWLCHLDLKGFAPASGTFTDITAASRLMHLTLTAQPDDLQEVDRALPLTSLQWHDMRLVAAPSDTFGMFSADGERAVTRMVGDLTDWLNDPATRPRIAQLNGKLAQAMRGISESDHGAIFDTDVRERIAEALTEPMEDAALDPDRLDFG
jgi:hypothetical protein